MESEKIQSQSFNITGSQLELFDIAVTLKYDWSHIKAVCASKAQ